MIAQQASSPSFWKDARIWIVLGLPFASGGLVQFIPATLPIFKRVLGSNLQQIGLIATSYYFSALLFAVAGGWFVDRLGKKWSLAATQVLLAGALVIIGNARSTTDILVGAFFLGLGGLAVTVITSTIISEDFGPVRQSLFSLQCLAGSAGTVIAPIALGWWLAHSEHLGRSWRSAYYLVAALMAALIPFPLAQGFISRVSRSEHTALSTSPLRTFKHFARQPAIYGIAVLNILHGISNGGMFYFVGQLYQAKLGIDPERAAYFLSATAGGFLVGRSLLSWITWRWRIHELAVLATCAAAETLGYAGAIASSSYLWGLGLFAIAGLFGAGDAPAINSYLGCRFSHQAATAFSLLTPMGFVGAAIGPYLVGFCGMRLGLERSIWLMPLFSMALSVMALEWFLQDRQTATAATNNLAS